MKYFFTITICFLIPCIARAGVVINEIAWMGTSSSANAEWIELYNSDVSSISLDGWTLLATDGSPAIQLSGIIPAEAYATLERTSDDSAPGVTATVIFTGSISNSGEYFVLRDNKGTIVDSVDATSGWPGGDNTTKETMQKSGNSWVTGTATPGVKNILPGTEINLSNPSSTGTGKGVVLIQGKVDPYTLQTIEVKPDPLYKAQMIASDYGVQGIEVPLSVLVKEDGKRDMVSGKFVWSLGDGSSYIFYKNTEFNHVYRYPGDYTITLTYYSNSLKPEADSIQKKMITIIEPNVSLVGMTDDKGVIIKNESLREVSLDNWIIKNEDKEFTFPKFMTINKDQELSISSRTLGFMATEQVLLLNPSREPVGRYQIQNEEIFSNTQEVSLSKEVASPQGITQKEVPEVKAVKDLWAMYQWHFIAGIAGILIILAYFGVRMYAERDEVL